MTTAAPTPDDPTTKSRSRLRWMLSLLGVLAVLAMLNRSWLASIPNTFARRSLTRHDLQAAEDWIATANRIASGNAESRFLLARIRRRQGDYDAARELRKQASDGGWSADAIKQEGFLALAQQGNFREPRSDMEALLHQAPWDSVEICHAFVTGAMERREYTLAMKLIAFWISQHPDDPLPYLYEAQAWHAARKWDDAEARYRQAFERAPHDPRPLVGLARICRAQSKVAEALDFYRRASAVDATDLDALVGQAHCLRLLGRAEQAGQLAREAVASSSQSVSARLELAQLELGEGKYEEALARLRTIEIDQPRDPDVRGAIATALRGVGETEAARSAFKEASMARVELDRAAQLVLNTILAPEDLNSRYEIGVINLNHGSEEEALLWLSSVLRMAPGHEATLCALAVHYEQKPATDPSNAAFATSYRARCEAARQRAAAEAAADVDRRPTESEQP